MCQETSQEKLVSTPKGCKQVREAGEIRNDMVAKRIKLIPPDNDCFYHVWRRERVA